MSVHDRDYYRDERPAPPTLALLSGRWTLIGVTVVAFLIQAAVVNGSHGGRLFFEDHLYLSLDGFRSGEVWQGATHALLHGGLGHLFWNMLGLYFFGGVAEGASGKRGFLLLYAAGALGGAAGFLLSEAVGGGPGRSVVGASGAVTAVIVYAALRSPRTTFLLFFVLPVPLYLLAIFFVGIDALKAVTGSGGQVAVEAHLGGAVAGWLFHAAPWRRWGGRRRGGRSAVRPAVLRGDLPPDLLPPGPEPGGGAESQRVDALLERIHAEGIASLTEEEREFLNRVSKRLRGRR